LTVVPAKAGTQSFSTREDGCSLKSDLDSRVRRNDGWRWHAYVTAIVSIIHRGYKRTSLWAKEAVAYLMADAALPQEILYWKCSSEVWRLLSLRETSGSLWQAHCPRFWNKICCNQDGLALANSVILSSPETSRNAEGIFEERTRATSHG
jgi:hypothetical protein